MIKGIPRGGNRPWGLAACLAVLASVVVATVALALIPDGRNSLEVLPCDNADWRDDVAGIPLVADVVRVADATQKDGQEAYDYDFASAGFDGLSIPGEIDEESWQGLADAAAAAVTADTPRVPVDRMSAQDLDDGLYLVLVHGEGIPLAYGSGMSSSLYGDSMGWRYRFAPTLVALPGRPVEGDEWLRHVTVTMKPTRDAREGSIRIDKEIRGFDGQAATFVFDVVGRDADGRVMWRDSRSIAVPAGEPGDAFASLVVDGIPAGLSVSVTESYPGAGYSLSDARVPDVAVTSAEVQPVFAFVNEKSDEGVIGGGISNKFVYDEDGTQDWAWHASPSVATGEDES